MKCREKKQFRTRNQAWLVAKNRNEKSGTTMSVYKCGECGKFHLTSRNPVIEYPKKFLNHLNK